MIRCREPRRIRDTAPHCFGKAARRWVLGTDGTPRRTNLMRGMALQRTLRHLASEPSHRRRTTGIDLLGADHPFVAAEGAFRQAARNLVLTAMFAAALAAFA